MQHYLANDQKLKKFVPLIKDSLVYPVIYDADRTLLSLPPIINGAATAVSRPAAAPPVPLIAISSSAHFGIPANSRSKLSPCNLYLTLTLKLH
jgi:phenylalanyl-tRNA synthetase beta chain